MRVLHLNTSDIEGGAARSAYRLHQGLQAISVDSQMLVRAKFSSDRAVTVDGSLIAKIGPSMSELPLRLYPQRSGLFSLQWFPDKLNPKVTQLNPDILNLHWIGTGFLRIETLPILNKALVWTLHDMWTFTGGCHYNQDCDRYTESCGSCPQLQSNQDWDLSRWVWQRKAKAWQSLDLTLVAPSHWMAKIAQSSRLCKDVRVKVIPNSLDTQKYRPIQRQLARELLNLPQDKRLILFSAMTSNDPRKGFNLLRQALERLAQTEWREQIELLILGDASSDNLLNGCAKAHYMGRLSDDLALALVYSAADIFAAPSTQDNLPNTVLEALACGTPCVAFQIGGIPDMVEHQQNGYLAKPYEPEDFANGLSWILENQETYQKLCARAREKIEQEFNLKLQANRYLSLYDDILSEKAKVKKH
jgi:glycosyltransferase involved in cell wall biosynthesis